VFSADSLQGPVLGADAVSVLIVPSPPSVSEICLKLLTIALLLILSKIYVVIAYYSISLYVSVAFISVYHKTVVLYTHLLISKNFHLFLYLVAPKGSTVIW